MNNEMIVALLAQWGMRVLGALAVLVIGLVVARSVRSAIRRTLTRNQTDPTLIPFASSLAYYLTVTFVIVAVLGMFGVEVTSIIAVLGAAAFAVGLALQGTLSNFAAGVMLLLFRPFKVGDAVDTGGTMGSVVEIGIFFTTLNTPDNVRVVVPNSSVWGQTIKNYAANETRRIDMVVGVSYTDDLGKAMEIIREVLGGDTRVLAEPAPTVAVSEMADSSVNIVVRPWCDRKAYWDLRFDLTRRLKEGLEAGGCSIPFPQRDVHLFQEKAPAA
jgi:small conductance mechanosensitive channel